MVSRNNSANIHAWTEERLSEYLDNRLAATEHAQIEQHLRECADCRALFESLRWTVALVKQTPAPALPRSFTLPVPTRRAPQRSVAFGLAQFATALATLLLIAVIGVDVITHLGGGTMATAPSAAKQYAAPTLAVAAAPPNVVKDQALPTSQAQATEAPKPTSAPKPVEPTKPAAPTAAPPTAARDQAPPTTQAAEVSKPTSAPKPTELTQRAAPTAAPQPTTAPPAAVPAPRNTFPTASAPRAVGGGATETPETKGTTADNTAKSSSVTPAFRAGLAITATATIPAPTATLAPTSTATSVPPTATAVPSPTVIAQARAEATRTPQPTQVPPASAQPLITPLRIVELGLLFVAIFFGALAIAMWRRR